jgi:hypothetical protein
MRSATETTVKALGAYAGLIALQHGIFEILQGSAAPQGILINAIGPHCEAEAVWHACLPAMTLMPSFVAAGALTVAVSLAVLVWALGFVERRHGGLVLMLLSLALLLAGGGFVAPFTGLMAGAAGTWAKTRLRPRGMGRTAGPLRSLGGVWPWPLVAVAIWLPGSWLAGRFASAAMLRLSTLLFIVFDLGLPVLTLASGFAHDARGSRVNAS